MIADFDVTEEMLRHFIQRVHQNRFAHPRVVVCVPSGVTGVEKRAVEEACLSAGARQAYLIEEPMAAAIGAGLPVAEPTGSMVLDIGGGTSEVAVISLGGIVVSESIRVGGDEMDEAIVNHCKHEHKLLIGQQTAEEVKLEIGSASPLPRGADRPRSAAATWSPACRRRSCSPPTRSAPRSRSPVSQIVGAVKDTLDRTPPELAGDIMDRGITLAGGGALLQGMDQRMRDECQMPAQLTESPLTCVAVGSGRSLEEFEVIHRMSRNSHRRGASATAPWPEGPAMYRKQVRRRRAVLVALDRRLRWCCSRSASGRPTSGPLHSIQRGVSTVSRPVEEGAEPGAEARARPRQLVRRDLRRPRRERRPAARRSRSCAAELADAAGRGRRERAVPQAARPRPQAGRWPRYNAGHGARDRPLADRLVLDRDDRQRLELRACKVNDPVITGDGLVGRITDDDPRHRPGDADHRPPQRRLGLGAARRPQGVVEPEVGDPDDLLLDFIDNDEERQAGRRSWSRPAGRTADISSAYPPGIPIGEVTEATIGEQETYQRIHVQAVRRHPRPRLRPGADRRARSDRGCRG